MAVAMQAQEHNAAPCEVEDDLSGGEAKPITQPSHSLFARAAALPSSHPAIRPHLSGATAASEPMKRQSRGMRPGCCTSSASARLTWLPSAIRRYSTLHKGSTTCYGRV